MAIDTPEPSARPDPSAPRFFNYRPRSDWRPWTALGATALIVAASVGFAAALVGLDAYLAGPRAAGTPRIGPLAWMAVSQLAMAVLAVVAATSGGLPATTALALGPPARGLADYLVCLAVLLVALVVLNALLAFGFGIDVLADLHAVAGIVRNDHWWWGLLVVGIGAPLSEELLFRGFLLAALAVSPFGFAGGALVATALWTLLHAGYTLIGIIEVGLIGLLFVAMLAYTGSLRVPIVCHALYNTALGLFLLLGPAGR